MKRIIFLLIILGCVVYAQPQRSVFTPKQTDTLRTFVDKTTPQTITGQKNFVGLINIPDSNKTIMTITNPNAAPYGDFNLQVRNFPNTGTDRPNTVFRIGHNLTGGGGEIIEGLGAFGIEFESHYITVGAPYYEFHHAFTDTSGTLHRPYTLFMQKNTGNVQTGITSNLLYFRNPDYPNTNLVDFYLDQKRVAFSDGFYLLHEENNVAWLTQRGTAEVFSNAIEIARIDTNNDVKLAPEGGSSRIRMNKPIIMNVASGTYKIPERDTNDVAIYNDDGELKVIDGFGETISLTNRTIQIDSVGLNTTDTYVDSRTGGVHYIMPANLVSNGTLTNWTGVSKSAIPDDWSFSFRDTTTDYVEQSPTGKAHIVLSALTNSQFYQSGSCTIGLTYGYSFTVSDVISGGGAIDICGVEIKALTDTLAAYYSGTVIATFASLVAVNNFYGTTEADFVLDDIKVWLIDGGRTAPTYDVPVILDSLGIRVLPDTASVTDGYVPKRIGNDIVWSPDVSTSGTGLFNPDGVTIDTTAGGLARIVPAIKNRIDSVWYKQPLDADLTDLADGSLTYTKVGGLSDSLTTKANTAWFAISPTLIDDSIAIKMNRSEMAGYSTTAHTHTDFFDTLSISWGVLDTTYTGSLSGWKVPNDITITEISAYTDANTVTFNLEERAETTPNSAGTDVMGSDLVADTNQEETSTFTNATIAKNTWLVPTISATGDVSIFTISVRYIKTD